MVLGKVGDKKLKITLPSSITWNDDYAVFVNFVFGRKIHVPEKIYDQLKLSEGEEIVILCKKLSDTTKLIDH
ncbi:MAG: hypothetical protein IH840_17040 [Candidatus Heimdallarchaeota archaeon]|nr:hypothetical protein [Candidatus Heimdallarchaeota archaeon]